MDRQNKAVEVEKIEVKYGKNIVVNDISFSVSYGEIFCLLGHNGAGKTTIINVLATLKKFSKGSVEICGYNILSEHKKIRENIALLSQHNSLDSYLSVYDNLYFYAWLQKIPRKKRKDKIRELLDIFNLVDKKNSLVNTLSGGTYRRVQLAKIFLSDAKIFLLDEPSLAFDITAKTKFWSFLKELKNRLGITIVLSTNDLSEAENICDRIGFLKNGVLVKIDTLENLKSMLKKFYISVQFERNGFDLNKIKNCISNISNLYRNENQLEIEINSNGHSPQVSSVIKILENEGIIKSLNIRKPNLTDVFITLNKDDNII